MAGNPAVVSHAIQYPTEIQTSMLDEIEMDVEAAGALGRICVRLAMTWERRMPKTEPEIAEKSSTAGLPSRQLWAGRDEDLSLYLYPSRPRWTGIDFVPAHDGERASAIPEEWFAALQPGFCLPMVVEGKPIDMRSQDAAPA